MKFFLKNYLLQRSKELNIPMPNDWKEKLYKFLEVEKQINMHFIFTDYGYTPRTLNAGSMIPKTINFTKEWAVQIVFFDNEKTQNAFLITVGHELTHKEKELCTLRIRGTDRKFVWYLNEVHADFGATQKMINSSRKALISSIEYKKALKKSDEGDAKHPSWSRRKNYVEKFNFDINLIRQIANDVNCKNNQLINKAINFYDTIILFPEI